MPFRHLRGCTFLTVKVFSNINLETGVSLSKPFFYKASSVTQVKENIDFGSGVVFDQKTGLLAIGGQSVAVNQVVTAEYGPDGKLEVDYRNIHPNAPFVILVLKNYNSILILDAEMFNSSYIQMFFLENYDRALFEAVELSPYAKVYRVKI